METELLRLSAFDDNGTGGNPAGVWFGPELPDPGQMLNIAAEVGYSETAFNQLLGNDSNNWLTRYYSAEAEVSFCGHATIATGVALGERHGPGTFSLSTAVGDVVVEVHETSNGLLATLQSVDPKSKPLPSGLQESLLAALGWGEGDVDPELPPGLAYAGAWHAVIPVATREVLASLEYDFESLKSRMISNDLTTIQVVWRESPTSFHARNPFPVGGVVEDPATGAAAAALGQYLRSTGEIEPPEDLLIVQGEDMGRKSILQVHVGVSGGIDVSGTAIHIGS